MVCTLEGNHLWTTKLFSWVWKKTLNCTDILAASYPFYFLKRVICPYSVTCPTITGNIPSKLLRALHNVLKSFLNSYFRFQELSLQEIILWLWEETRVIRFSTNEVNPKETGCFGQLRNLEWEAAGGHFRKCNVKLAKFCLRLRNSKLCESWNFEF